MAEDATPLVEALLAIIHAARAYLPQDEIGKDASSPGFSRRLTIRALSPLSSLIFIQWRSEGETGMPTIDFTDAEPAPVTAAIRRTIEDDRFPRAPRLVPLRTAMAKLDEAVVLTGESEAIARATAPRPTPLPKAPAAAKADKRARR
jgi:hypothetical protein